MRRAHSRKILAVLASAVAALACATGAADASANAGPTAAAASSAASWNTVWSTAFNGPAGTQPSRATWQYDTGQGVWGTNEVENMTASPANVSLTGHGQLAITPRRVGSGWTSGRIETTRRDFTVPAGGQLRVSARIHLPDVHGAAAAGYWPAFWMLGSPQYQGEQWPQLGEIDAMEAVNGLDTLHGTMHCGVGQGGPCNETTGRSGPTPCRCWGSYLTYRIVIDRSVSPERVEWFVNGRRYWTVTAAQVGQPAWSDAIDHGFDVILDVAMGGNFPGAGTPKAGTQGGHPMLVDGVTVQVSRS